MANMTKEEAYRAGYENPLIGDISPLQRLYGTIGAIGEELGGGDMGTPFGQRFASRQKATKAEIKRLQELRAKFPEEFGQGMMKSSDVQDPYLFGQVLPGIAAMRPGVTTFSQIVGPQRLRQGAGVAAEAEAPRAVPGIGYAPRPAEPYYRNVPGEMGTSPGPMSAYNQNMYGMSTGRYGPAGAQYAPEMAVTDFESYGPMGARPTPGPYAPSGFDRNMLAAYRQGRYNRMAGGRPGPMGGDFTLEELGSAPVPYRQGGLVYEPVGQHPAAPRQIGGPQGAPRLGYERGPIEGEWSEVGHIPYGGGYRPNFTMEGAPYTPREPSMGSRMAAGSYQYTPEMAVSPTGMRFDPRLAAAVIGGGAGYMAGSQSRGQMELPPMDVYAHRGPHEYGPPMPARGNALLPDINIQSPAGATALSGQAPGPGTAFEQPASRKAMLPDMNIGAGVKTSKTTTQKAPKKGKEQGPPMPTQAMAEPNLNYYVTQALDRLFGQDEANRGLDTQQYYATHPWPY